MLWSDTPVLVLASHSVWSHRGWLQVTSGSDSGSLRAQRYVSDVLIQSHNLTTNTCIMYRSAEYYYSSQSYNTYASVYIYIQYTPRVSVSFLSALILACVVLRILPIIGGHWVIKGFQPHTPDGLLASSLKAISEQILFGWWTFLIIAVLCCGGMVAVAYSESSATTLPMFFGITGVFTIIYWLKLRSRH